MNISLIKDENALNEVDLRRSYIPFIPKSKFALTNKRILAEFINVLLWIIPIGKNEVTYPLNQVAGVRIDTKFNIKAFILGIVLIVLGIASLKFIIGIVPIVLGVLAILSSFETLIVIQSAAGSGASAQIIKAVLSTTLCKFDKTASLNAPSLLALEPQHRL
jgi:hypothetical protein